MDQQTKDQTQDQLRQLAHDLQHCLHVIGLATNILKSVREDEAEFTEVCDTITNERQKAMKLVNEFRRVASEGADSS